MPPHALWRQKAAARAKRCFPAPRPASFSESVRLFDILGEKQLGKKSALAHTLRIAAVCVARLIAADVSTNYQTPKLNLSSGPLVYVRESQRKKLKSQRIVFGAFE